MFCRECGSKLSDLAIFCSNCGTKVTSPASQEQQTIPETDSYGLPAGIKRSPDGRLWLSFMDKKDEVMCYFGEEQFAIMYEVKEKKKSVLRTLFTEVADIAAIQNDDYPFLELPSEMLGEGEDNSEILKINGKSFRHYPYKYRSTGAIKEDKKHNIIKLYTFTWQTLRLTEEQYDFVLDFLLAHCRPDIKRK